MAARARARSAGMAPGVARIDSHGRLSKDGEFGYEGRLPAASEPMNLLTHFSTFTRHGMEKIPKIATPNLSYILENRLGGSEVRS